MGVYGNLVSTNEAMLFLSNDGKKFKNEIKEHIKNINAKTSALKNALTTKESYSKENVSKMESFLKSKSKTISGSTMVTITTYTDGVPTGEQNFKYYILLKNDTVYQFKIYYNGKRAILSSFNEIAQSKINFPIDIVEKAINSVDDKYELSVKKNGFSYKYLFDGGLLKNDEAMADIIQKYCEQKYKDKYTVGYNKLTKFISIKSQ